MAPKRSPTALSLELLDHLGYRGDVVERFIQTGKGGFRRDLWGFGDILAMHPRHGLIIVQATADAGVSARVNKVEPLDAVQEWLELDHKFEVWGWSRRRDKSTDKKLVHHVRRMRFYVSDGVVGHEQVGKATPLDATEAPE